MRTDWILFTLLALLWLGAGGIRLRLPGRTENSGERPNASSTNNDR
jgi:hypothetical protein